MTLHPDFLRLPMAHRGLHDIADGRPENSRAAIRAAIAVGYGIEIDLQLSADGQAIVFHDYYLDRLTAEKGPVRQHSAADLASIPLAHGDGETIPTLEEILTLVAGRVPLLIEIKDQDGIMGGAVGRLEAATAKALKGYDGPVAVMSFNPHSVRQMKGLIPDIPRGITTSAYRREDWPLIPVATLDRLRRIPDYPHVGACFISHEADDLHSPVVADLKARGAHILTWTTRSPAEEAAARQIADNVTFEGYLSPIST